MSPTYASSTEVAPDRSRAEIERTLTRFGATGFMYGWDSEKAIVAFQANGRQVRFHLPMPDRQDRAFTHTEKRGNRRSADAQETAYNQAVRQRWRALSLVIKAKLEAVESGITTFDSEFAMHMVLPDGRFVADHVLPAIHQGYEGKSLPLLLPGGQS